MCSRHSLALLLLGTFIILQNVQADMGVIPNEPRVCYACDGITCQMTTKTNVTTTCTDQLDICVTIFNDYEVLAKGCYLDMPDKYRMKCDEHDNLECYKCFGQLCNNKGRADFKCIECNSKDDKKCTSDTSAMTPVQCSIPTAPNSYCYVRDVPDEGITRGCYGNQQDQLDCWNNTKCSLCLSSDGVACNAYEIGATGAAAGKMLSLGASISLLLTLLLR